MPSDSYFRSTGTIEFLYKPLYSTFAHPENRELDQYAAEREQELRRSEAQEIYREFWRHYPILFGNIYGAVPTKLLDAVQYAMLVRYGWKPVVADLIFFRQGISLDAKQTIAEQHFEKHIVVDATEYTPTMLFHFRIVT
ncbi:MAG: hypothetical protein Q4A52_05020 [Bacillota bacterium]|nr:hypothetical protein [Bacillota bacterium]